MCNHLLVLGPDPGSRQPWVHGKHFIQTGNVLLGVRKVQMIRIA